MPCTKAWVKFLASRCQNLVVPHCRRSYLDMTILFAYSTDPPRPCWAACPITERHAGHVSYLIYSTSSPLHRPDALISETAEDASAASAKHPEALCDGHRLALGPVKWQGWLSVDMNRCMSTSALAAFSVDIWHQSRAMNSAHSSALVKGSFLRHVQSILLRPMRKF